MSNTGFLITDIGLAAAAVADPQGPYIKITGFKLGSAVGYEPTREQTDIQGSTLYASVPTSVYPTDADTLDILLVMSAGVGTFQFGEIGLYLESGELFAICVFDALQEKIKAVGNVTGNVWKIHALIKLAQAPAVIQVTVTEASTIQEFPLWENLPAPDNLINPGVAVIVHEPTSTGESIFLIKDTALNWTPIAYRTLYNDFLGVNPNLTLGSNWVKDPAFANMAWVLPRTDSRYIIRLPGGQIRRIAATWETDGLQFEPGLAAATEGQITIFEEIAVEQPVKWVDAFEYNEFSTLFNPQWATAVGPISGSQPYPASNKGLGQPAIPTLNRTTVPGDWSLLLNAVKSACFLHDISTTDLDAITDFVYRPVAPLYYGYQHYQDDWEALEAKIPLLEANRNVFNPAALESSQLGDSTYTHFFSGVRQLQITLAYNSASRIQAMLNTGHTLSIVPSVTGVNNPDWDELRLLFQAAGTINISASATTASAGTNTSVGLMDFTTSFQTLWSYTSNNWTVSLQGRRSSGSLLLYMFVDNTATSPEPVYGANQATVRLQTYSVKCASTVLPATTVIENPDYSFTTDEVVTEPYIFVDNVVANLNNYNLRTRAMTAGWNGTDQINATINVASGVIISAANVNSWAFDTDNVPVGSDIELTNNGYIIGRGGKGANANTGSAGNGITGEKGGPGLRARSPIRIRNNGIIASGGGGGGSGAKRAGSYYSGAGGGAANGGAKGTKAPGSSGDANAGTVATGGFGQSASTYGGKGGDLGQNGQAGQNYGAYVGGLGGTTGHALDNKDNIEWIVEGTVLGPRF